MIHHKEVFKKLVSFGFTNLEALDIIANAKARKIAAKLPTREMSNKIKPRQQKKPRNMIAYEAITRSGAGPHKDRRDKRQGNPRNNWENDHGLRD